MTSDFKLTNLRTKMLTHLKIEVCQVCGQIKNYHSTKNQQEVKITRVKSNP